MAIESSGSESNANEVARSVDDTVASLRQIVVRLQAEIVVKRQEVLSLSGDLSAGDDFELIAQSTSIAEVDTAEIVRDLVELSAAEHALSRCEAGQYGVCEQCGQPIRPDRLKVQPTAVCCVACQEALEAGQAG